MTVANTNVSSIFNANGVTREWNLDFHYNPTLSGLYIYVRHADGTSTDVVTNYELDGNVLTYPTIESELDPLPTGEKLVVERVTPITQSINLTQQGPLDAETLEGGYDKDILVSQEINDKISRAIIFPPDIEGETDAQEYINSLQESVTTASNQATIATTQAGIATTQAELAKGYAESIDLSNYRKAADQDIIDATKQDILVSGTNIKTVNGNSLLGSGNVDIDALPSQTGQSGKFLTTNGTTPSWAEIPTDVDNKSVSLNSNDEIQTVGVIDQNDTTKAIKTWTGKRARFDAIVTKDPDTIYNITDDAVLTDFANTSLSNLTNAGKIVGAGLGMPSSSYIDLTLGASGTTYTAPADGWVIVAKRCGNTGNNYLGTWDNTVLYHMENWAPASANGDAMCCILFPVKKGHTFPITYSCTGDTTVFRFIYSEGSKSEAN